MRILIVDDEPLLTRALQRLLSRLGHSTLAAACGDDAVQLLEREAVDVVLCDVRMPRGDGPSTLRRLRARGDQTPLVFITGYAESGDAELRALGACAVLAKPVTIELLVGTLAGLGSPSPGEA